MDPLTPEEIAQARAELARVAMYNGLYERGLMDSERSAQMNVNHAGALANRDAEIAGLRNQIGTLTTRYSGDARRLAAMLKIGNAPQPPPETRRSNR